MRPPQGRLAKTTTFPLISRHAATASPLGEAVWSVQTKKTQKVGSEREPPRGRLQPSRRRERKLVQLEAFRGSPHGKTVHRTVLPPLLIFYKARGFALCGARRETLSPRPLPPLKKGGRKTYKKNPRPKEFFRVRAVAYRWLKWITRRPPALRRAPWRRRSGI